MTIQNLRGIYYPEPIAVSTYTNMTLAATGHRAGVMLQIPESGTLEAVGFRTLSTSTARPLRLRVETLGTPPPASLPSTPSGTLIAAGAEGTVATVTANTWFDVPLDTPPTVTRGQRVGIAIDSEYVGTLNMQIARMTTTIATTYPLTVVWNGTSWSIATTSPILALKINGAWVYAPGVWPISNKGTLNFSSSSTPNERGNRFSLPFKCRVEGVWFGGSGAVPAIDLCLYDLDNTLLTQTSVPDGGDGITTNTVRFHMFDDEIELPADFEGRVTMKPTSTTNVVLRNLSVPSVDHWAAITGGGRFKRTTRKDSGAWTDATLDREDIGLILSGVDDGGAGGGGATGRAKIKSGGVLVDLL